MEVKAQLNNLRRSPRKVRLVASALRGLDTKEAESQLRFLVKGSAQNFEKLLKSAISNAENNFGLSKDNLYIKDIVVDEGTKLKRWLPRAYGRASLILKRTSDVEMILAEKVEGKDRKKIEKAQTIKDVKPEDVKEGQKKGGKEAKEPAFTKAPAGADALAGRSAGKEEKKEIIKEREAKEFVDEKKKSEGARGFFRRVFRRKSM